MYTKKGICLSSEPISGNKAYSVTIKSNVHKSQIEFQESEFFKEKSKERYKIDAKNSELKYRHRNVVICSKC